ncbi:MAG: hypothetical protein R3F49_07375 [Planctomycetota bacterium]
MTAQDQAALRAAAALHGKLARASAVARGNSLWYVVFGVASALFAVSGPEWVDLAQGVLVAAVGAAQLRESPRLARGAAGAAGALARNELILMCGIIAYCALRLTVLRPSGAELQAELGDTSALGIDVAAMTNSISSLLYGTLLAVTLVYQGGLALYFRRRAPLAERYVRESPAWARETVEGLAG